MSASIPPHGDSFRLRDEVQGALPIVEHCLGRLGVDHLLDSFVPATDSRMKLHPAKALGVLVRNLSLCHQPLYSLGEWAAPFDPALLGLLPDEVRLLNDDRVGRALVSLFDADRASLLNRLVLDMATEFSLDCSQLHNDSTSVTLQGAYRGADRPACAQPAPPPARHHLHGAARGALRARPRAPRAGARGRPRLQPQLHRPAPC